jgi:hypothetical protein
MKLSKSLMFVFFFTSWNVEAAVVTWTLDNVTLSGPAPFSQVFASGSFDYDATIDVYSNINITSVTTYNNFSNGNAVFLDASGSYLGGLAIFNFNFDTALTDAGGTISTSVEETLLYPSPSAPPILLTGSGFVTAAPAVPIPAAVWLFGSGIIGLIGIARRKKS